jgi:hypothetical protein
MKKGFFFLITMCLGLSACSIMKERSQPSGYYKSGSEASAFQSVEDFYRDRARQKWGMAKEELGILKNTQELSDREAAAVRARLTLQNLENQLEYSMEKKQYYNYKPYFRNDYERIQFLRLENREVRERFAKTRGIAAVGNKMAPESLRAIENTDIHKGMLKEAVIQSWGEPDMREVDGNEAYGNERWHYKKLVSSEEGYKQENRILYFESGRIVGWETL